MKMGKISGDQSDNGMDVEKTDKPLQIFISYAHTEKDLCDEIMRALKKRGHHPWYDEEQIHHGNDWRERITRGIKNSQAVVSCLSKSAVREKGVCLDELSIAIGVRGGNIRTILLEPEKDVRPPASVCHIQWLDMSGWRKMKAKGAVVFQPWFDGKMRELIRSIESKESQTFAGEIEEIRGRLHVNYSTSKQRRLLQNHIIGREWLIQKLEDWLDDPDGARLCVLYGEPGVGKSAFAAKYIHYNPRVVAGLFCEYDNPHYNDPQTISMTLAYLLACRLPNYRVILTDILEHEKRLGKLNASELFDLLLANPLSGMNIDGGQEILCIVIDGLDECAQGEFNALAETLSNEVPRLPKWLRVLVTSREVPAVTAPLAGALCMKLRAKQEQNLDDIREYYTEQLEARFGQEADWESALAILTERSGGIFQYAVLVADGILKDKMKLTEVDKLPEGLAAIYHRWFGWFFPEKDMLEFKQVYRPALGMILAAPEPLPSEELCRVLDWDEDQLGEFIRKISVLLQRGENVFLKETLTFSHAYLGQWLDMDHTYACKRHAGEKRMAQVFYALYQKNVKKLTEFEALYLTELLTRCGETEAAEETKLNHDLLWRIMDAGDYYNTWGSLSLALKYFSQARDMAEKMVNERSTYEDMQDLASCYEKSGDFLVGFSDSTGVLDLNSALELYKRSVDINKQLLDKQNVQYSPWLLSTSFERIAEKIIDTLDLADLLGQTVNLDGILEISQKYSDIRELQVYEHNTPLNQKALADSYVSVADIMLTTGNWDGALELYRKSLNIFEQLKLGQSAVSFQRNIKSIYAKIANILRQIGDLDDALKLYRKIVDIDMQQVQEQNVPMSWFSLSMSYSIVADILQETGDLDGALEMSQRSLDIAGQLAREQNAPQTRRNLSVSYNNLANILRKTGDLDSALEQYKRGLDIAEQLARDFDLSKDTQRVGIIYNNIKEILVQKDDQDAVAELHQRLKDILSEDA